MTMLHTVNKSPFEKNSLGTCLRLSAPGHSILLIEDGIYGAIRGGAFADAVANAANDRKLYVLKADLSARGIAEDRLLEQIQITDYNGFVRLAAEASKVQSWL